jgi:ABC-2 type transport system ATP-binding protein
MSAAAIFENAGKFYPSGLFRRRGTQAVKGVNLQIPKGQVFGLLGPNRAGKTTLVKLLLSLARLSEGSVTRLGKPASDPSTLARVGYMHENQHFPRYLTATQLLHYYGGMTLLPASGLDTRVNRLLEMVGLADRPREPISHFSKGMVQRLGLAQALLNEPDLLILDEPTEGLDLTGRQLLRDVVVNQKKRGGTAILVSHVLTEVESVCDRVAVLINGRVARVSAMADLLKDAKTGASLSLEQVLRPMYEGARS